MCYPAICKITRLNGGIHILIHWLGTITSLVSKFRIGFPKSKQLDI